MKSLLISDGHLTSTNSSGRTDNLLKTSRKKLEFIFKKAQKEKAIILQAGDMTNTPRDFVLLFWLIKLFKKYKPNMYCVGGQHDSYHRSNKPSIQKILQSFGYIKILNEEPVMQKFAEIYGSSFGEDIPIPKSKLDLNILVCHANISDRAIYPGHEYSDAENFLKKHNYDLVLCGDVHNHFVKSYQGRLCVNTGPVLRRSIAESHLSPCYFLYDSESRALDKGEIPHKDSFDVEEIARESSLDKMVDRFSKAIRTDHVEEVDAIELLEHLIKKNSSKISKSTLNAIDEIRSEK